MLNFFQPRCTADDVSLSAIKKGECKTTNKVTLRNKQNSQIGNHSQIQRVHCNSVGLLS